jgi:hypothetical protein
MKTLILKRLISKNGFFDREKLINLSNKPIFQIYNYYFCKFYFKFLKINLKKSNSKKIITTINPSKVYDNAIKKVYGEINFINKLKNKIKKFL